MKCPKWVNPETKKEIGSRLPTDRERKKWGVTAHWDKVSLGVMRMFWT
jgi:hypothetical protein